MKIRLMKKTLKKSILTAITLIFTLPSIGQVFCPGDSVCLTVSARGNIQWQNSTNGISWSNIPGETGDTLCMTATQAGWYRAEIVEGTCNPVYSDTSIISLANAADTFKFTGSPQYYIIPSCADTLQLKVWGAQGGFLSTNAGGQGGYTYGEYVGTPGDTLWIYVGGKGTSSSGGQSCNLVGGWNGGGPTGDTCCSNAGTGAGSGGGGSDIRVGGTSLKDRIIVAGGGGGAYSSATVGAGGGATGGSGGTYNSVTATGGTQSAGGKAGGHYIPHACSWGSDGSLGQGGKGDGNDGGGGGGGYYGGGGGPNNGGGAGGSSYIGGVVNGTMTQGGRTGDGLIIVIPK